MVEVEVLAMVEVEVLAMVEEAVEVEDMGMMIISQPDVRRTKTLTKLNYYAIHDEFITFFKIYYWKTKAHIRLTVEIIQSY